MNLEDYFDFHTTPVENIRIKGTRIDIDFVIEPFKRGETAQAILARFRTLDRVQVDAAITYYLRHRAELDEYLERREQRAEELRRQIEAQQGASDAVRRIRAIKAARAVAGAETP